MPLATLANSDDARPATVPPFLPPPTTVVTISAVTEPAASLPTVTIVNVLSKVNAALDAPCNVQLFVSPFERVAVVFEPNIALFADAAAASVALETVAAPPTVQC